MTAAPARPVLRYFGGKWKLAPWVLAHFPPHRIYVEPFGGAASLLLRKERSYSEVYNDLDGEVVSLFRILRDPRQSEALLRALRLTPFARDELRSAYEASDDVIENARRLIVRSYMGFGSNSAFTGRNGANSTGFRSSSSRSGTTPAHDWKNYPQALVAIIDRVAGITIENKDAVDVMLQHDRADVLHFVDPPYVLATRSRRNPYCKKALYRHELTDADHARLIDVVRHLAGMVVLCGYASELYDASLRDWRRVECAAFADGARPRTEVLWISPSAADALDRRRDAATPLLSWSVA